MDVEAIKRVVEQLLKERFGDDVLLRDMRILHEEDSDGDPVLRVEVVFDAETNYVPAERTKGLIRRLRPRLSEIGENAFPVMSFIAAKEMGKRAAG